MPGIDPDAQAPVLPTVGSTGNRLWHLLRSPWSLLLFTMLIWSSNWIVGRGLHTVSTPFELSFVRWSAALLILLPTQAAGLWAARRELWASRGIVLRLGATGVAGFNTLIYIAVSYTEAVNAVLVASTQPVLIAVFAWAFYGERIRVRQWTGIAISLLGVLLLIARGNPASLLALQFNPGDLVVLSAMPIWGLYTVWLAQAPRNIPPITLMTALMAVGVVLMAPLFALDLWLGRVPAPTPALLWSLVYLALFPSLLAFLAWNRAVSQLGPSRAGLSIHLVPLFATIQGAWLLGEHLHWYHGGAALLIFGGIALTARRPRPLPAPNSREA